MKARAWLSMFLIVAISFTGFGLTTSDLTKNSTAVTFDSDVVGVDIVTAIVVNTGFLVNETHSYVFSDLQRIESEIFKIKENFEKPDIELVLVPPLSFHKSDFNIKTSPKLKSENHLLTYRRARDGISQNS